MSTFSLPCVRILLIGVIVSTPFAVGCAGRETSKVTTTEVRTEPATSEMTGSERESTVEVTKTEEVTQSDGHKGFFGIVGDIIALPFRAIASIL